jgi:HAD superfamily hydrolase (TIGR01509 family)
MIIFDCDGVLVDSEILSNTIDAELMTAAGCPMTAEELIRGYIGRPKADIWRAIGEERGTVWPDGLIDRAGALLLKRMETELHPVAGVADALAAIRDRKSVASSSALPKLRKALAITGLLPFFEPAVFSASQVARGKPAPDVFLFAASQCDVAPADCIVVEDSVAGVTAALSAGMRVLGFTGGRHSYAGHGEELSAAGALDIVTGMQNLPLLLTQFA